MTTSFGWLEALSHATEAGWTRASGPAAVAEAAKRRTRALGDEVVASLAASARCAAR